MTEMDRITEAFRTSNYDEAEGHLSELQWESLACGELDRKDLQAALDHILGCSQCTEIHQSLLVLKERAHSFDPGAPVPGVTRKTPSRNWVFGGVLAVAATLFLVIFRPLTPSLTQPEILTPHEPVLRSSTSESLAIPLVPNEMDSVSKVVFRWQPSPIAPVSIIQLVDDHGEIQWTSEETTEGTMELPGDVALPSGRYYWRVLSLGGTTGKDHASDLVAFDVTGVSSANRP